MRLEDEEGDDDYDPVWENAMQTAVDVDEDDVASDTRASRDAKNIISEAEDVGFYLVNNPPSQDIRARFGQRARIGDEDDMINAHIASKNLLDEKNSLIKHRVKAVEDKHKNTPNLRRPSDRIAHAICTTLKEEAERAQELYERLSRKSSRNSPWSSLRPYQRLCFSLVIKHTLNDEQTRAFLLLADKIGVELEQGRKDSPITLLCTGPGGTGKSVIFRAWKDFYEALGHPEHLRLTAPTGVVASDIGGCTIHSEASLRVSPAKMKSTPKLRTNLEERIAHLETLILDEVYFLNSNDLARLSEYLCMGKGMTDEICGGLNWVTCGDPCQLPPPQGRSLFSKELVQCHFNDDLNDLHENIRQDVKGVQVWHQLKHVVVLEEIMWQKDPVLIAILKRLRKGLCTAEDKAVLDKYVLSSEGCSAETKKSHRCAKMD
jgi:hypothetical protein